MLDSKVHWDMKSEDLKLRKSGHLKLQNLKIWRCIILKIWTSAWPYRSDVVITNNQPLVVFTASIVNRHVNLRASSKAASQHSCGRHASLNVGFPLHRKHNYVRIYHATKKRPSSRRLHWPLVRSDRHKHFFHPASTWMSAKLKSLICNKSQIWNVQHLHIWHPEQDQLWNLKTCQSQNLNIWLL